MTETKEIINCEASSIQIDAPIRRKVVSIPPNELKADPDVKANLLLSLIIEIWKQERMLKDFHRVLSKIH